MHSPGGLVQHARCWGIALGLWIRAFTKQKESYEGFQTFQDFKNNLGINIAFAVGLHSE